MSLRDFGEIFGDLLPGNNAKLQYAEPGNIAAGLEVKVQLGSIWKLSLTELSGGQRYALSGVKSGLFTRWQILDRPLAHHVSPAVQACTHVHIGRGGRRVGSLTHPAYRRTL